MDSEDLLFDLMGERKYQKDDEAIRPVELSVTQMAETRAVQVWGSSVGPRFWTCEVWNACLKIPAEMLSGQVVVTWVWNLGVA